MDTGFSEEHLGQDRAPFGEGLKVWRGVVRALGSSREAVLLRAVAVAFELSDPGQVTSSSDLICFTYKIGLNNSASL